MGHNFKKTKNLLGMGQDSPLEVKSFKNVQAITRRPFLHWYLVYLVFCKKSFKNFQAIARRPFLQTKCRPIYQQRRLLTTATDPPPGFFSTLLSSVYDQLFIYLILIYIYDHFVLLLI